MRSGRSVVLATAILAHASSALADARLDRALAEQRCEARDPNCDWLATLSSLERASVKRGLVARGYELEPSPWGKVVGAVRVYNEDVFAERDPVLSFFNRFHYTSRESVVLGEVVVRAGEVWDQERVQESARRLRDPLWSSVVAVVPVKSREPGKVDLLVVTRDVWSLRLNTQYTFQLGSLTNLNIALSENNFLGTRNVLALGFTMNQGSIATGPLFIDKNVFNKYIDFRARVDAILEREAFLDEGEWKREGSQSTVAISKSLASLADSWGGGLSFNHRFAIDRSFRGLDLRTYDNPDTPETEALPFIYRMRRWGVNAYALRQLGGKALKHQITFGHGVDSQRPRVLEGFPGDDIARAAFERDVLPRSERTSVTYVTYGLFTPRFRTFRNVGTYDLAEDVRFGPDLDVNYGVAFRSLGSSSRFQRAGISLGWTFPIFRDGFFRLSAGLNTRLQHEGDADFIDNSASGTLRVVTPSISLGRLVTQTTIATRWDDRQNAFYTNGSDDALRGFLINQFFGDRLVRSQWELRSVPVPVWVLRGGLVAFYEIGSAANSFRRMELHQDVGIGFRVLIPQTSREPFRFDLAFPLDGETRGRPQFIAAFESAF